MGALGGVKRFLKRLGVSKPKAYVVLSFEPGEAAQVDFGSGPHIPHPKTLKPTKTHIFVMTLCDSRHMYAELVWDQKVNTWLRCHRNAFEFFGGVPARATIDNLKSAITRACHRDPEVQRSYGEFSKEYGFQIEPCRVKTPEHKGRVARGVGYVKSAFVPDRVFRSLADGNRQLVEWVLGEAGNRIHGTTQEVPLVAFAEREKEALRPLPEPRPEIVTWAKAKLHPNCHISFEKSHYSAPFRYVGQQLHVRAGETMVEIYLQGEVVALHPRAQSPGTFRSNLDHYRPRRRLPPKDTAMVPQASTGDRTSMPPVHRSATSRPGDTSIGSRPGSNSAGEKVRQGSTGGGLCPSSQLRSDSVSRSQIDPGERPGPGP